MVLRDHGYKGTLSMECEGQGGPMIERALAWLRKTLKELRIKEEYTPMKPPALAFALLFCLPVLCAGEFQPSRRGTPDASG